MLRKGKCEGKMRGETLAAGESKTVHGSEGMTLIYCGAGEVKLCSKSGAKLMLAKAKAI